MKKWKIILPVVLLAAAGGWLWYARLTSGLEADAEVVAPSALTDSVVENGVVRQTGEVSVLARVGGGVAEVLVRENDAVSAGDVLVRLDDRDLQYQKRQAESAIDAYAAQIDDAVNSEARDKADLSYSLLQLQAELDGLKLQNVTSATYEEYVQAVELELSVAQSNYDLAASVYDSKSDLYELDAISKSELDAAAADLESARSALSSAQTRYDSTSQKLEGADLSATELDSSIRSTEANIQSLQNKLATDYSGDTVRYLTALIEGKQADLDYLDTQLEDCLIRATVDGVVTGVPAESVSYLAAGQTAATILAGDGLTVEVDIPADSAPYLQAGQQVTLTQALKQGDVVWSGTIIQVYDYAMETTSALGLDEYKVRVVVQAQADADLLPGSQVEVSCPILNEQDVLTVPNSAIFEVDEQDYVFTVQDGRAVQTPVTVGSRSNTRSVISEGISEGDTVLSSANLDGLSDGVRVKVVTK